MDIPRGKVVLEFYSERCVTCRTFGRIVENVIKDYGDVRLIKVDVRKNRDLAKRFGVIALPVAVFLKDGKEVDRIKGAKTEKEVKDFIERNR